ncbi:hypothetical protein D3C79_934650 [compost metagenome]
MQPGADFNGGHPVAIGLDRSGKFANAGFIGARRQANKKLTVDQQHVAAVKVAVPAHPHHRALACKQRRNGVNLTLAAWRTRMGDHGQLRHHHSRIFHKVGVREGRGRR